MLIIWLGALLIMAGLLYTARQTLRRGRLSVDRTRAAGSDVTLEPPRSGGSSRLATAWPGVAMIAVGVALLIAGAAR